ncbi:MAG TPA: hypothetical protein VIO60_04905 [Rectinemataceae bacterium]
MRFGTIETRAPRLKPSLAAFLACATIFVTLVLGSCASSKANEGASVVSAPSALAGSRPSILAEIEPAKDSGRVLVVYFSQGEATRWVAEDLAEIFGADVEEVVEKRERAKNFLGFMTSGFQSTFGIASRIEKPAKDPAAYDTVFVLSPIWSWNLAPPMRSWLEATRGKLPKCAFLTVSGDTKPDKVVGIMAKVSASEPAAIAGFTERDFKPENRASYIEKLKVVMEALR